MADDKYQLNEEKNVDFVNRNFNRKIELDSKQQTLIEYDIKNVLNVATTFENERQLTNTYRIYGSIEYFSILNGIPTGYTSYLDFFDTQTGITKSFLNDFKVYLVKPYGFYDNNISGQTGFTKLDNNLYIKNFEIITELENFEIFNAGYDKNLFSEQRYSFDFNTDINLTDQYDGLYFPITDLFLYVEYQPKNNGSGDPETMSGKTYDDSGNTIITAFTPVPLNVDDVLTGDVIEYDKNGFKQTVINTQEYYINTPCDSGGTDINIIWKYDHARVYGHGRTCAGDGPNLRIPGPLWVRLQSAWGDLRGVHGRLDYSLVDVQEKNFCQSLANLIVRQILYQSA